MRCLGPLATWPGASNGRDPSPPLQPAPAASLPYSPRFRRRCTATTTGSIATSTPSSMPARARTGAPAPPRAGAAGSGTGPRCSSASVATSPHPLLRQGHHQVRKDEPLQDLASGTCSQRGSAPCPPPPRRALQAEGGHALRKPSSPARRHPCPRGRGRTTGASSTATSTTSTPHVSPTFLPPLPRCLLPRTPPRGLARSGSDGLARGAAGSGSARETEARLAASAPHTRGGGGARRGSCADSTPRATGKQ